MIGQTAIRTKVAPPLGTGTSHRAARRQRIDLGSAAGPERLPPP